MKKFFLTIFILEFFFITGCETIEKKSSAILENEEALEKWIGQPKSE